MAGGLAVVAAAALCIVAVGKVHVHMPGEKGFCTQLSNLLPHSGALIPAFSSDVYDYTLNIANIAEVSVMLTLYLDPAKYNRFKLPSITIDGEPFVYNWVLENNYVFRFGCSSPESILHIHVEDPKGRNAWFGGASPWHDYHVRIIKPLPDYCTETPKLMEVSTPDGHVLNSTPPMDYSHLRRRHRYVFVLRNSSEVTYKIRCPDYAAAVSIDGKRVLSSTSRGRREVTGSVHMYMARQSKLVQCVHNYSMEDAIAYDPSTPYELVFERRFNLSDFEVEFRLEFDDGNCTHSDKVPAAPGKGYLCQTSKCSPRLVPLVLRPLSYVPFQYMTLENKWGTEFFMKTGVERTVPLPQPQTTFAFKAFGDEHPVEYRIHMETSAEDCPWADMGDEKCSSASWICGFGFRLNHSARSTTCAEGKCGVFDAELCCEPCHTFDAECNTDNSTFETCPPCWHSSDPEACCIEEVARRQRARLAEERLELERRRQEQRLAHFAGIGCYPDPQPSCHNRTCYYDETCQLHPPRAGGLGCWAAKLDVRCRYCGFAHYDACPEDGSCFDGMCQRWPQEKAKRCSSEYGVTCFKILVPAGDPQGAAQHNDPEADEAMLDAATEPTTSFPPPSLGATTSGAPPGNMSLAEKRLELEREKQAERLRHFERVGCSPEIRPTCRNSTCYFDETCLLVHPRLGGRGCGAMGVDKRCRLCGFGDYDACPEDAGCFDGLCETWSEEKSARCLRTYDVQCQATLDKIAEERLEREQRRQVARLAHFQEVGCSPEPGPTCHNRTCFYDETCQLHPPRRGGIGCWAAELDVRCRYCGFANYDPCPKGGACFDGECQMWSMEKATRCSEEYGVACYKLRPMADAALVTTDSIPTSKGRAARLPMGWAPAAALHALWLAAFSGAIVFLRKRLTELGRCRRARMLCAVSSVYEPV